MEMHKFFFGKGSKEKSDVIREKVFEAMQKSRQKEAETQSEFVTVVAQKDIKQAFGTKYIYNVKKGDRFKVPKFIYHQWMNGARVRKQKPPVLEVKADSMRKLREERSK